MNYLIWKLNHAEIRRLCVSTSYFEHAYHCWFDLKEYVDAHTDLKYEKGDDINKLLEALSQTDYVSTMVSLANHFQSKVYEGYPPPDSEINVRSFFESLFGEELR